MAMFGKKKNNKPSPAPGPAGSGKDTTYLGQKIIINGTVSGDGNVIILGQLEGKFDLKGELTIAEPAIVRGEIRAGLVAVKGRVEGKISARDKLHLEPSARVSGKVHAKRISMLEGAQMDGELVMSSGAAAFSKDDAGAPAKSA